MTKTSTTNPNNSISKINLQLREQDKEICSSWISKYSKSRLVEKSLDKAPFMSQNCDDHIFLHRSN